MSKTCIFAVFVICSLILAGCESVGFGNIRNSEVRTLNGTTWTLKKYGAEDSQVTLPAEAVVNLTFDATGQRVTGISGCNRYSGSINIDGKRINFGPTAGTRRACAPHLDEVERIYLGALASTITYRMTDDSLAIEYGRGELLSFEAVLTD